MTSTSTVLIIDDDPSLQRVLSSALKEEGYHTAIAGTAESGEQMVADECPQLVLLDVNLPGRSGLELLADLQASQPDLPVIVLTAQNTVENAIAAMQKGAFDYVTKPFDLDELYETVRAAISEGEARGQQPQVSVREPAAGSDPAFLVGTSAPMQAVYKTIGKTAPTDATALITGESGTGKELVARALHKFSPRSERPFVAVNMTAIPGELLEAELFGYEKGAFTGATQSSPGKFREAQGGTLLLDEIGDMPLELQGKLLRVLQEREITPLGGRQPIAVDVRVVAATQVPLDDAVEEGRFRNDLYYRIKVVQIDLPPLRDRPEDVPALCDHFLQAMASRGEIAPKRLSDDARSLLQTGHWPGNVRQLENVVRRVALLSPRRELDASSIRELSGEFGGIQAALGDEQGFARVVEQNLKGYVEAMAEIGDTEVWDSVIGTVEQVLLRLALDSVGGNQLRASELLGINRNTMRKKLTEYRIDPRLFKKNGS